MLSETVSEACVAGEFGVYAVATIHEALTLFTGMPAGDHDAESGYAEGTLLRLAQERALAYWQMARPRAEA